MTLPNALRIFVNNLKVREASNFFHSLQWLALTDFYNLRLTDMSKMIYIVFIKNFPFGFIFDVTLCLAFYYVGI